MHNLHIYNGVNIKNRTSTETKIESYHTSYINKELRSKVKQNTKIKTRKHLSFYISKQLRRANTKIITVMATWKLSGLLETAERASFSLQKVYTAKRRNFFYHAFKEHLLKGTRKSLNAVMWTCKWFKNTSRTRISSGGGGEKMRRRREEAKNFLLKRRRDESKSFQTQERNTKL
ncbi:hypothetical protein J1N35_045020 [Gossypium stocksii]|uniref:Uncharacterized protein n=1 Tax=Gossypium stocksii TaxID=47602 RepID=A0A9D3UA60_9ROSI|nr:hypothetical protein J1N35_045020 [Gossypium stocksii]